MKTPFRICRTPNGAHYLTVKGVGDLLKITSMRIVKNMGNVDRIVRTAIAVLIISLSFSGIIHGPLGYTLLAISVIFLATSLFAYCPLYALFGIHTCRKKDVARQTPHVGR
jgi:hypothetical protein